MDRLDWLVAEINIVVIVKMGKLEGPTTRGNKNPSPSNMGEGFINWGYIVVE